jgi:hypothetical protein
MYFVLTKEGGKLGDEGGDEHRIPELPDHGDDGVGRPDAEPQQHIRDRHLQHTLLKNAEAEN